MRRRKSFLLSGFFAMIAISLDFIVPPLLPSPIQAEIDELRRLLDAIDEDAAADDLDPNRSGEIQLDVIVVAFNATKARATLLAAHERAVCGTVKSDRLLTWAQLLTARGYARILAEPRITTMNGRSALVVSGGEMPVASDEGQVIDYLPFGVNIECKPTLRKDGAIQLWMQASHSALKNPSVTRNGVPQLDVRRAKGLFVLRYGQSCYAVLPKVKTVAMTDHISGLSDLPWVGDQLRWPRKVEIEEEMLFVVTPRCVLRK